MNKDGISEYLKSHWFKNLIEVEEAKNILLPLLAEDERSELVFQVYAVDVGLSEITAEDLKSFIKSCDLVRK